MFCTQSLHHCVFNILGLQIDFDDLWKVADQIYAGDADCVKMDLRQWRRDATSKDTLRKSPHYHWIFLITNLIINSSENVRCNLGGLPNFELVIYIYSFFLVGSDSLMLHVGGGEACNTPRDEEMQNAPPIFDAIERGFIT